jgi:hypothetical protein
VAAVLGGLLLLVAATRIAGVIGGWLALLAGAWYVVGPTVSMTWEPGTGPIGRPLFGTTRQVFELLGYFYGVGALILALAAFSIGRFVSRPRIAEEAAIAGARHVEPVPARESHPPPAQPAPPAARTRTRWRFPFPRRGGAGDGARGDGADERAAGEHAGSPGEPTGGGVAR